jgi:uncharacterized surface protein with fasciclin (FAS1) repeats
MRKSLMILILALATAFGLVVASNHATSGTIVDVAIANDDFNVLVDAVVAADLADTLAGEGPFTVFAPTDEAFAAALEALGLTAEELLASDDLAAILTYHVVPARLMAADVLAAVEAGGGVATVETVHGAPITVEVVDGNVVLNGTATVIMVDVEASNGVIHVIDAVILPPDDM